MKRARENSTRERIYLFIRDFIASQGYGPSVRDIVRGCNLSSTAVAQHHINVLHEEGRIKRDAQVFRSIHLSEGKATTSVPLLGTIAAGQPIDVPAPETWSARSLEMLDVPPEIADRRNVYALRVKGQSMVDALIDDGDIVLMEPVQSASNGEMVAVWFKDRQEVTLKRIYTEPDRVCLKPANQLMQPIYTSPDNIEVQGRVIGVIRKIRPA